MVFSLCKARSEIIIINFFSFSPTSVGKNEELCYSLCKAWSEISIIIIIIFFFLEISVGKNEGKEVRHFRKQNIHSRHAALHFPTLRFPFHLLRTDYDS